MDGGWAKGTGAASPTGEDRPAVAQRWSSTARAGAHRPSCVWWQETGSSVWLKAKFPRAQPSARVQTLSAGHLLQQMQERARHAAPRTRGGPGAARTHVQLPARRPLRPLRLRLPPVLVLLLPRQVFKIRSDVTGFAAHCRGRRDLLRAPPSPPDQARARAACPSGSRHPS